MWESVINDDAIPVNIQEGYMRTLIHIFCLCLRKEVFAKDFCTSLKYVAEVIKALVSHPQHIVYGWINRWIACNCTLCTLVFQSYLDD